MNTKRFKLVGIIALMVAFTVTMAACDLGDDEEVTEDPDPTVDVSMTVVDHEGEAIPSADVTFGDETGQTDENGVVEFSDKDEGESYDVTVERGDLEYTGSVEAQDTVQVDTSDVAADLVVDITVVDEDGNSVNGALVELGDVDQCMSRTIGGEDGIARLFAEDGSYTLEISAENFEPVEKTIQVADDSRAFEEDLQEEEDPVDREWSEVETSNELVSALRENNNIELTDDVSVESTVEELRMNYSGHIDLGGNKLTLNGQPLVLENNDILLEDGTIVGEPLENVYFDKNNLVLLNGEDIEVDDVTFDVPVFDWFQRQDLEWPTTRGLVIDDSTFNSVAVFVSDVEINDAVVTDRLGIETHEAELNDVTFEEYDDTSYGWIDDDDAALLNISSSDYGILYVSDAFADRHDQTEGAQLNDLVFDDDFTGMYVGKSLKYATIGWDFFVTDWWDLPGDYASEYTPARPELDGAFIDTSKRGMVWWGLNHRKAELHTTGTVEVRSQYPHSEGFGLTLVGTDYRDYSEGDLGDPFDAEYVGGRITGDATFEGDDVHFGWYTNEWVADSDHVKDEDVERNFGYDDKYPVFPEKLEDNYFGEEPEQVKWKHGNRLTIHGPTFDSMVEILTVANEYVGMDDASVGYAPFEEPVYLGDVLFNDYLNLWGDFKIIDDATVTTYYVRLKCGNIRKIFAGQQGTTSPLAEDWEAYGTLEGEGIITDTKEDNVLVLGDNLLLDGIDLEETLYNVVVEDAKLLDLDIEVGDANLNNDREIGLPHAGEDAEDRFVTLTGDVHIAQGAVDGSALTPENAIFEDVMWTLDTEIDVMHNAVLTLEGMNENVGDLYVAGELDMDEDDQPLSNELEWTIDEVSGDLELTNFALYGAEEQMGAHPNWDTPEYDAYFTANYHREHYTTAAEENFGAEIVDDTEGGTQDLPHVLVVNDEKAESTIAYSNINQLAGSYIEVIAGLDVSLEIITPDLDEAFFDMTLLNVEEVYADDEEITVEYSVENTGQQEGTQDIELRIEGEQVAEHEDVPLDRAASATGRFVDAEVPDTETPLEAGDTFNVSVHSENSSDSVYVTVQDDDVLTVTETTPEDGDVDVAVDLDEIVVEFSHDVDLDDEDELEVDSAVDFTPTVDEDTLTMDLEEDLDYDTEYTVTVGVDAVSPVDADIEPFEGYTFTFTTEEEDVIDEGYYVQDLEATFEGALDVMEVEGTVVFREDGEVDADYDFTDYEAVLVHDDEDVYTEYVEEAGDFEFDEDPDLADEMFHEEYELEIRDADGEVVATEENLDW